MQPATSALRNFTKILARGCIGLSVAVWLWVAFSSPCTDDTDGEAPKLTIMNSGSVKTNYAKEAEKQSASSQRFIPSEAKPELRYDQLKELTLKHQFEKEPIFFVESSGHENLSEKCICAIESAALHHPDKQIVCVMLAWRLQMTPEVQALLREYSNVVIYGAKFSNFVTYPKEVIDVINSQAFTNSSIRTAHSSDFLRMSLLWHFGGTYLDTDVVVLKQLPTDEAFIGAQDKSFINGAIVKFPKQHPVLEQVLSAIPTSFRDRWGSIGPAMLTKVLKRLCHLPDLEPESLEKIDHATCPGFRIYPPAEFYPVHGSQRRMLFRAMEAKAVMEMANRSSVVHIWGKNTKAYSLEGGASQQPYAQLASKNCPVLYAFV